MEIKLDHMAIMGDPVQAVSRLGVGQLFCSAAIRSSMGGWVENS